MAVHAGDYYTGKFLELGRLIRGEVLTARGRNADFSGVSRPSVADTIYQIDAQVEPVIHQFFTHWAKEGPLVLIAEGVTGDTGVDGKAVFPQEAAESDAAVRIIMDPIDGTRGLMYDKRPAWVLMGAAENKGDATRLSDIFAAAQVEIPTSKQTLADLLWAVKGKGAKGMREEVRATVFQKVHDLKLSPSQGENIDHGFATVSNFFPGTKELSARLMEEIARACIGELDVTRATVFDDQYITTGGQLYELMVGHDRFIADMRPLFYKLLGFTHGLCVHPYDVSAMLIAREAGIEISDGLGGEFDGPLDVESSMQWAGWANRALRARIEPVMLRVLKRWIEQGVK